MAWYSFLSILTYLLWFDFQATRKPTIGQRKPQNKKGGLGAKKTGGLGAQKVKKDFAEIEREAELADQGRLKAAEDAKIATENRQEDEAKAASTIEDVPPIVPEPPPPLLKLWKNTFAHFSSYNTRIFYKHH